MTAETITAADTRINARWLIPVEPFGVVLEHQAVILQGSRILAIVPQAEADQSYRTRETLDLNQHVVLPGLINLHGHTAMSLFRGLADDLPLMTWLNDHIWPAESKFVSEQFVADGTRLAMAEMLRTGTTTFSDMYFFPEVTAQAAHDTGMRAQICFPLMDMPTVWGSGPEEYLRKGADLIEQWQRDDYIMPAIGPHAPYTVSDDGLMRVRVLADELDIPIHMHVHETQEEIDSALAATGLRPLARLKNLELLSPRLIAVHLTQLLPQEIEDLSEFGVNVVHCPESNMKLASGSCPIASLQDAAVNVALGTDGAAARTVTGRATLDLANTFLSRGVVSHGSASFISKITSPRRGDQRPAVYIGATALRQVSEGLFLCLWTVSTAMVQRTVRSLRV